MLGWGHRYSTFPNILLVNDEVGPSEWIIRTIWHRGPWLKAASRRFNGHCLQGQLILASLLWSGWNGGIFHRQGAGDTRWGQSAGAVNTSDPLALQRKGRQGGSQQAAPQTCWWPAFHTSFTNTQWLSFEARFVSTACEDRREKDEQIKRCIRTACSPVTHRGMQECPRSPYPNVGFWVKSSLSIWPSAHHWMWQGVIFSSFSHDDGILPFSSGKLSML